MLYQYFDAKVRYISGEIASLERKTAQHLSSEDLQRLSYLRLKKSIYDQVFDDLCQFVVDLRQYK